MEASFGYIGNAIAPYGEAPFRAQAIGELYAYLPLTPNNEAQLAAVSPDSRQNADYGFSVGRGSFCLHAAQQWIALAFRVKLNDVGLENGKRSAALMNSRDSLIDHPQRRDTVLGKWGLRHICDGAYASHSR